MLIKKKQSYYESTSFDKANKLKKWQQILTEVLASEGFQELQFWNEIRTALEAFSSDYKEEQEEEWFVTKKSTYMTLPTFYGSNLSVPDESYILNTDKASHEKFTSFRFSLSNSSEIDSTSLPTSGQQHKQAQSGVVSTLSPLLKPNSKLHSSLQGKPQTKSELRESFRRKIEDQNPFVLGLINTFVAVCKGIYQKQKGTLQGNTFTPLHEDLYSNLVSTVKCFVGAITNFLCQIYEDKIPHLDTELGYEDLSPFSLIESVVYEFVFLKTDTYLKDEISYFLRLKYADDIKKFREVFEKRKNEKLESYDHEVLQNSRHYLLESSQIPYGDSIQSLKSLLSLSNPYSMYELLNFVLEDELWSCIYDTYKDREDSIELLRKLKGSFGMEIRLPIMIYCVVQSQCEDFVIARRFVEEFIEPQILDASIGFTTFQGCIDHLIYDEDFTFVGMMTSGRVSKVSTKSKRSQALIL